MSSCCRAAPCEALFDERIAAWYLRRYQRRGVGAIERRMLADLGSDDVQGHRVLEIGGGVGAIQAELLKRGAREGEVVELVGAYRPYAARLAEWAGVAGRSSFRVADVLSEPGAVERAHVTVLNRVVCCSSEGLDLVSAAASLTTGKLLLSFPRNSVLARSAQRLQHGLGALLGNAFRFYVRPAGLIRAAAEGAGMELVASGGDWLWEYMTFRRKAPS